MTNEKREDVDVEKVYGHLCKMPKEEFISKFKVTEKGLNTNQVNERIQKEKGKNENLFGNNARVDGGKSAENASGSLSLTA